ncbi:MAG: hypothetical protein GX126_09425 [Bacteroidales bacterium]|nr:hypothetical protein [Bacteroidales bacterium]
MKIKKAPIMNATKNRTHKTGVMFKALPVTGRLIYQIPEAIATDNLLF